MKTLSNVKATTGRGRPAFNVLRIASNVADTETVTIGNDVYEFDNNATFTAGRIQVVIPGLTPTNATPCLVAAINAYSSHRLLAIQISVNEVLVVSKDDASAVGQIACTETMAGANNAWSTATMTAGCAAGTAVTMLQQRAATAQDVAIGTARFYFPFTVAAALCMVRTTAGVVKTWDGATTFTGQRVDMDNAGSSDWAATDVLVCLASS
jgi:hypothetical protein